MPLLTIEFVGRSKKEMAGWSRPLADARGARAVFISATLRDLPTPATQSSQVSRICEAGAAIPPPAPERIHVIYEPPRRSPMALGGQIV